MESKFEFRLEVLFSEKVMVWASRGWGCQEL